jgi:membrane protein DedA with SNARE-associated domain
METLLSWLSEYGYFGLFALLVLGVAGLPIPDETIMVFCGYLISRGRFHPVTTWLVSFGGTTCGITISYLLGRTLGTAVVERYGRYIYLTPKRLDQVHRWFERTGEWLLTIGYFIPAIRHFTAVVAGMSELRFRTFALFAYSGAVIWVSCFLTLGYLVGENWRAAMDLVHRYTYVAVGIGLALLAVFLFVRARRNSTKTSAVSYRESKRPPRT